MKFKVGDIVKAIGNDYTVTSLYNGWVGIVTKASEDYFNAKTLYCYSKHIVSFDVLKYEGFELLDEPLEEVINKTFQNCICYHKELFKNLDVAVTIKAKPQILDEVEKRYLSNVIRPFRDRVICISKVYPSGRDYEYIEIEIRSLDEFYSIETLELPCFKAKTMYKGMEDEKKYTLEELGL